MFGGHTSRDNMVADPANLQTIMNWGERILLDWIIGSTLVQPHVE